MKALVGVDPDGLYENSLNLLSRLRFPKAELELIHADAPLPPYPDAGFVATPEIEDLYRASAEELLVRAETHASIAGFKTTHHLSVFGSATGSLEDIAERIHADIIAIGSHEKSALESLCFGSVGRGLAISSKVSVLIAKGQVGTEGAITAVFAIDYSVNAELAVRRLIDMQPHGFERIILLTVLSDPVRNEPTIAKIIESEASERAYAAEAGNRAVEQMREAGIRAEVRIVEGNTHPAIEDCMTRERADLLILGAPDHGFFERLTQGSVSLSESIKSHHPVLIIRPASTLTG